MRAEAYAELAEVVADCCSGWPCGFCIAPVDLLRSTDRYVDICSPERRSVGHCCGSRSNKSGSGSSNAEAGLGVVVGQRLREWLLP